MNLLDLSLWALIGIAGFMIGKAHGIYNEQSKIPPAQISPEYCYKNLKNHGDRHWSADIVPCGDIK